MNLCRCSFDFGAHDIKVNCKRLWTIDATKIPLVGASNTDFLRRYVSQVILVFDRCALSDDTAYFELLAAKELCACEEAHFEIIVCIYIEKFSEALLKDRISKRVGHNVEAACHFKAWLHLYYANLIKSCDKYIKNYPLSLRSSSTLTVKLNCWLKMACIISFFLNVQMRTNFLWKLLIDDFSGSICYWTSKKIDNSRASASSTCSFQ